MNAVRTVTRRREHFSATVSLRMPQPIPLFRGSICFDGFPQPKPDIVARRPLWKWITARAVSPMWAQPPCCPSTDGEWQKPAIFPLNPLEVILFSVTVAERMTYAVATSCSVLTDFEGGCQVGRCSPRQLMAPLLIHFLCVATLWKSSWMLFGVLGKWRLVTEWTTRGKR